MDVIPQLPSPWDISPDDFPREGSETDRLRFLIRYALLAPSTRNTQPWRFRVANDSVELHLDLSKWQRIADADQREMFISLGCALENLLIAATHFGYRTAADYLSGVDDDTPVVRVRVEAGVPAGTAPDPRFDAITRRRTNHGVYDGTPVPHDQLEMLCESCTEPGLRVEWITDEDGRAKVDALVMRADAVLLSDPEYRHELGEIIGAGAFGTPWLLATLGRFAVSHLMPVSSFSKADHKALMSSPALGVICAPASTRQAQVRVGQVLERLYLAATLRALALQPVSQILQLDETREALSALLPDRAGVPIQPFRLGHAPPPRLHTPRRSLDEVLV
jgi:nitroreductase